MYVNSVFVNDFVEVTVIKYW